MDHNSLLFDYGNLATFADMRLMTDPSGQQMVVAHNHAGLSLTILPDRGLDIWLAQYQGQPLTWLSPGSPHAGGGGDWLTQFNGGLLTTCGLTQVGSPETDSTTGEIRGLHGRYSQLRASELALTRQHSTGDLELSGTIWESSLFGSQIALRRTIGLPFARPMFTLRDVVTNHGDTPTPLMLLYHFNLGFPLVQPGAEFVTSSRVYPRDEAAQRGLAQAPLMTAPEPRYAEQVFFHHLILDASEASAGMLNDTFGLVVRWNHAQLGYLTQWKNLRSGRYLCGLEPGNCIPEGQNAARAHGRLDELAPGESRIFELSVHILAGKQALDAYRAEMYVQRTQGTNIENCSLSPYSEGNEA